jgi:RNA polymerase sigma-70 factor (ECF subfamily)
MDLDDRVQRLVSAGDADEATTAVVEALGPRIHGYLKSLHGDEDDAADVFQAWAEDVWRGLASFRRECSVRAWSYRLAWHASARFRREGWRRRRERLPTSAASRLAQSVLRSRPVGARDERLEILGKDLDPEDRTLLLLRLDLEMPWEEIAAVLAADGSDATPAALRKRFQRLKERLAELAREKGLLG